MAHRENIPGHFSERTKSEIQTTLKDENDVAVTSGRLTTATLTLYDQDTDTIINSQDGTDISSYIDGNGLLSLPLSADDMQIITATAREERHIALINFTWDAGADEANLEMMFIVKNLNRVP